MFKVSVIIPVYNAERFVRRAVESAVHLEEVGEVILIEDNSPDNALAVCRQLERANDKVRLFRHPDEKNHGAGASRNLGIIKARCEFISFLDADDWYLPKRFEAEKEIFKKPSAIDGVYGAIGIYYYTEIARQLFIETGYKYQELLTVTAPVAPEELILVFFGQHQAVKGSFSTDTITVRRSLFDRVGLFNEKLRLRQDTHMWARMAAVGRLASGIIKEPIAIRGVHDQNRMTNTLEQRKYDHLWWDDLYHWFRTAQVNGTAWKAFEVAYIRFKASRAPKWTARLLFLWYTMRHPRIVAKANGLFDFSLYDAFGRNWWTLHFTSFKNRILAQARHDSVKVYRSG